MDERKESSAPPSPESIKDLAAYLQEHGMSHGPNNVVGVGANALGAKWSANLQKLLECQNWLDSSKIDKSDKDRLVLEVRRYRDLAGIFDVETGQEVAAEYVLRDSSAAPLDEGTAQEVFAAIKQMGADDSMSQIRETLT